MVDPERVRPPAERPRPRKTEASPPLPRTVGTSTTTPDPRFERYILAPAPEPGLAEKLRRTWARHPLVALLQHKKRVTFYQQFLSLVRVGSGMPVVLTQLARWAPSPEFRRAIEAVAKEVTRGSSLGEALRRHASTFDDTNVELLVFAEQAGGLDTVLQRIVAYMEKMQKLRWSVVTSLIYPAYLVLAFTFVGPLLGLSQGIREGAGVHALPGLYVHGLVLNLIYLGLGCGVFLGMPMALVALGLDKAWDRLKLKLPLFGPAFRAIYGARFFTALALGTGAGVEIARTVTLALRATGSADLESAAEPAVAKIRGGATLADTFESLPLLDPMAIGSIAIGEKTGTLDETLEHLADEASESAVRRSRALAIAGVVVLTAGAFIAIIQGLLGVILGPIWDYYKQLGDI